MMFDNICTFPLPSEVFAQALHPTEPLVALGLLSGHVVTLRLPALAGDEGDADANSSPRYGVVQTEWKTRRHKMSCRCAAFSVDGEVLFTAGADGIVKAASALTGQVSSKIATPLNHENTPDAPSAICALAPNTFLLGTDSAVLYLYDLRSRSVFSPSQKPQQTHRPHADYVSSITPLPASEISSSGLSKQWVTTGGSTLAVTDIRKGILSQSEGQEEDLLSSAFVGGLSKKLGRKGGEKILVGEGGGVLTLWDRGNWEDQQERIVLSRGEDGGQSLDSLAVMPAGVGSTNGRCVAVGMDDGNINIVELGMNKVIVELRHDELEGVSGLQFDMGGRLVSSGGLVVKVWREAAPVEEGCSGGTEGNLEGVDSDGDNVVGKKATGGENVLNKQKKQGRNKGRRQVDFTNID